MLIAGVVGLAALCLLVRWLYDRRQDSEGTTWAEYKRRRGRIRLRPVMVELKDGTELDMVIPWDPDDGDLLVAIEEHPEIVGLNGQEIRAYRRDWSADELAKMESAP